jgi:hypothetical protein
MPNRRIAHRPGVVYKALVVAVGWRWAGLALVGTLSALRCYRKVRRPWYFLAEAAQVVQF